MQKERKTKYEIGTWQKKLHREIQENNIHSQSCVHTHTETHIRTQNRTKIINYIRKELSFH